MAKHLMLPACSGRTMSIIAEIARQLSDMVSVLCQAGKDDPNRPTVLREAKHHKC